MPHPGVPDSDLIRVLNAVREYGNARAAAEALGLHVRTVQRYAKRALELGLDADATEIQRPAPVSLLSEDETKRDTGTIEEVLADLRALAEANPKYYMTRNFYRVHGSFSESAWNCHFGKFHEFKRQAKIMLARPAHRAELAIAKHASVDHYRAMTEERWAFGENYIRPHSTRYQIAVIFSDVHDRHCDPFYRRVLIDTVRRSHASKVICGGDLFDLYEFGRYAKDPRDYDVLAGIRSVHELWADLREVAPDAEFKLVEGNHEARLLRHLADATPALKVLLSDLHGFTVSRLLGLDKFQVNYVARCELAAWTVADHKRELRRNYTVEWGCLAVHHEPIGKKLGIPGVNGHHHAHICEPQHNHTFGAYEWHQLGSGQRRAVEYANGDKWGNGFMVADVDTHTQQVTFHYIDTTNDHALALGKRYLRTDAERMGPT